MLKENWRFISRVQRAADLLIVSFAFILAYYGRDSLIYWNDLFDLSLPFAGDQLAPIKDYFIVLLSSILFYAVTLDVGGAYMSMRLADLPRLFFRVAFSAALVFTFVGAELFLLKIDLSRSFLVLFCSLSCFLLILERYCVLGLLRYWRRRGRNFRNLLLCGCGAQAKLLSEEIRKRPELGIGIKGFAHLNSSQDVPSDFKDEYPTVTFLSGVSAVEQFVQDEAIDEVIFTDIVPVMAEVEQLVECCSELGIRTTVAGNLFSNGILKSGISYFGGMPLIHFQTPPGDRWELSFKRLFDIAVSLCLLILTSPVFILVGVCIVCDSRGPVLFKQKRVGLNGRLFSLYKFRSMYTGAEEKLDELKRHNMMSGPVFKMKDDPRVTRVGKFIRRLSIDELPQLWNVLRGDMSLVGPRPPVPGEVSMYERKDRRRLSMRPGITCIWQVCGRNQLSDFEYWVKLDLQYIDNWSLKGDFVLLARTIPAVLLGKGAH